MRQTRPAPARGDQSVRFGKCDSPVAGQLRYPAGEPVADVLRTIETTEGQVIYFARVIHRADVLQLRMELAL